MAKRKNQKEEIIRQYNPETDKLDVIDPNYEEDRKKLFKDINGLCSIMMKNNLFVF